MTISSRFIAALYLPFCAVSVKAALPDAGSLLRQELQNEQKPAPSAPAKAGPAQAISASPASNASLTLKAFRLTGLSAQSEAEAQAFLAPHLDKNLSVAALHQIAAQFEKWLRNRGLFVARAYIPPQDIEGGVVEIRVLEGKLEGIEIKRTAETRLPEETLRRTLSGAQPQGTALEQERMERGLLLLNDLPATSARAVLSPGTEVGGSRVIIEAAQGPILSGNVELDNTGNRFTGDWRLGAALNVNDPYGQGDQWSLRATTSQGSTFGRLGYSRPLGSNGLKVGLNWIESQYSLCCDSAVTTLEAEGKASAVSGFVSFPFIRTRMSNLTGSIVGSERHFVNRQTGTTSSDKKSQTLTLGLQGDISYLGGRESYTTYAVQWALGQLNLDGSPDKTQDATTAQSNGHFDKLTAQLTHLLRVTTTDALYVSYSGQWAGKNLDSSEKFVLGGPQGVRAYPTGEAVGDEGWLLNLEWRREINRQWRTAVFADYGEILLHRNTWSNWNATTPSLGNRYALSGVGVSVVWLPIPSAQITSTLATHLGSNPARDSSGRNSDNRSDSLRFWLQASVAF